jgi:hypothetical protein
MTTKTQVQFVLDNLNRIEYPILEVGCKYYPNSQSNLRPNFNSSGYVGVDAESGSNVDIVCDLTSDISSIREKLPFDTFKTIICLSVMEHCINPFTMASNIEKLLDTNGLLFFGAPFVWNIHGFPNDYWRFTPEGARLLFTNLIPEEEYSFYSTKIPDEKLPLSHRLSVNDYNTEPSRSFLGRMMRKLVGLKPPRYPYMLYPVDVNILFKKK